MAACGLKQRDLADVLHVPLDRIKSLTSGKVKKFDPDETRRLVQTLNLNAHWLATGTGEMFNPMGGEQLGTVLAQLKLSSSRVEKLGLPDEDAIAARDIAMGVGSGNSAIVISAIQRLRQIPPTDEQLLVDTYRRCTPAAKANLIQTAALLSAGIDAAGSAPRKPKPPPGSRIQTINAPVHGAVAAGNVTITRSYNKKK